MNTHARQRGALVVIAMILLAGVAAMGGSLAKMQISGVDVAAEYSSGNKSFNLAETAIQMGLKQFKDAECDPSAVTGAAEEDPVTGSTTVTQSLGEMGNVQLIFCPMDGSCYPDSLMPDDEDVNQGTTESADPPDAVHEYWHHKHGKHAGWFKWLAYRQNYRHHHFRYSDRREHWRKVQHHRKECHGPRHRHHNNYDYRCMAGGSNTADEDSVNYWMLTAVDTSTGKQRKVSQVFSCESGPENTGNLFTGSNYAPWNPKAMITQATGKATFGAISSGSSANMAVQVADASTMVLPEDGGQDVWFHGTFKIPAPTGSSLKLTMTVRDNYYWGFTRTILCGDKSNLPGGMSLTKLNNQTLRCEQTVFSDVKSRIDIKCDGSVDADCNISQGKLHFNLGKLDTARIRTIRFDGKNTELYDAFLGDKNGGTEATAKPTLNLGQWVDDL
ncbi:MAG: hypothetical protein HQL91_01520 [Magnetococcales bacterium]|nr:hypothetical protein [Magnetococcales bacterium]